MTVNRWCGSSLQAVQMAAGLIATNAGEAFIAGGAESMTKVPMMGFNMMPPPERSAVEVADFTNMGLTAEHVAAECNVTRHQQDAFAVASQAKALAAQAAGRFADEIAPVTVGGTTVATDGCVRETTLDQLAGLRTVFLENGTVTAGTSSPMTDGATAVMVCSEAFVKRHGLKPLARVASFAVSGCEPAVMGLGPIESSLKALRRAGLTIADIGVVEMNEAFAAPVSSVPEAWAPASPRSSPMPACRSTCWTCRWPRAAATPAPRRASPIS